MKISVVIPVYNEEKNIPVLYKRLKAVLNGLSKSHEIIFVDDGSLDLSLEQIINIRKRDRKVKAVCFSRNFGHMAAVDAGLAASTGRKVIITDADLQDPPEIIPRLYAKAEDGFDVVYGIKRKRKESLLRKTLFKLFYKVLNGIAQLKMPLDAGTFSVLDRKVVNILISLPERNKYFSGLRAWTGFKQTGVTYERGKRHAGKEASLGRLFNLAVDGLISFSHLPLRIASFLGIFFAVLSLIFIIGVFVARFVFGKGIVGWASTMTTILFIGSIQLITLGVIGEYLARIYDEVKGRPEYIVSRKIGL
ncbi:MAG: Glycosyl transferase, family 2 [Candidatus Woesebacteria bacterium GW2011_GWB1_45_5]|uniref:Glycosyl transferase, family 2 n=1 Tax=Candidatus Woesebacteria bacterium GW2011_GWB1_45_5 TaxID=1618581 RepID=A0A0G1PZN6_9BACT|nr:MAG: Glycosyl transferase, family 2 [Candidatus Woesebacteria bacterium GW2011_GWB1_45_5]